MVKRYADVYNAAFRSGCVSTFVRHSMSRFKANPIRMVRVPRYVDRMLRTQGIGQRVHPSALAWDAVAWALRVSRFVERRAARTISRSFLRYWYHPSGPWMREQLRRIEQRGWSSVC